MTNMTMTDALAIARDVFPALSNANLLVFLWLTDGYPCFWATDDPAAELRAQLEALRDSVRQAVEV